MFSKRFNKIFLAKVKYKRLFLLVKRDAPRIRPRIEAKGFEENTANVGDIFIRQLGELSHLRFTENVYLRSVKHSSLNSATVSLSDKSGDRIILTREKIDLSLRATNLLDEPVDPAMYSITSNFYCLFIRGTYEGIYETKEQLLDTGLNTNYGENCNANEPATTHENGTDILQEGTFSPFSGSLEDLVNTFDEKITSCFRDYGTNVESLAPVQVRTQEEIMNECQMWWTITGTFGNILPIDWSKSYARKMHMPALNLNEAPVSHERPELEDLSSEDEAVATDLDMHALILSSSTDTHSPEEPLKTAEEVLREIDDIMQESPSMERSPDSDGSLLDSDEALERSREVLGSPLHEKKLKQLTSSQLTELLGEMESLVGALSETLIAELALRDELEYEKELKNQFISLLLAVQNRRRQHHVTRKRNQMQNGTSPLPQHRSLQESKYLTTVIPYHMDSGPPDNQALQVLIKILKAISEDSPTVPTLLTDYILKVLCPT